MSLRVIVCFLFVLGFSVYAWRNWFASLIAGIVLMAFLEHPDMPRGVLGIQGLNLWNLLFANVTLSWLANRRREGLTWDMPQSLQVAFALYIGVTCVAFLRLLVDPSAYYEGSTMSLIVDYLVNPLKFLLPCFLLYDGCRKPDRVPLAVGAIALAFLFLAVLTIKAMGLHFDISGDELNKRAAKILTRNVGYHRVDLAMMMGGACWVMIACSKLFRRRLVRWAIVGFAGVVVVALALTGGRTGYATWGLVGLTLCVLKWRHLLPLVPVGAVLVILFLPGVAERMTSGFGGQQGAIVVESDRSEITSGRTTIWPYVIEKITENPIIGYGRCAMMRTGLAHWLQSELGEEFGHPHNAYLEFLFDNGIIGFLCVIPIYFLVLTRSLSLFRDRSNVLYEASGGTTAALVLALLLAGLGAQTFYVREGVVWMWASVGVTMRLWVEREKSRYRSMSALAGRRLNPGRRAGHSAHGSEGAPGTNIAGQPVVGHAI